MLSKWLTSNLFLRGSRLHFIFCAVAILVGYMYFGILQEKTFQGKYADDDRFTFTFSVLFIGSFASTLYAALMLHRTGIGLREQAPKRCFIPLAFTHLMSVCTTVGSLQKVSYPVMVVIKSTKPIFVMLCAAMIGKVRYSSVKYIMVFFVVFGIMLFMYNAPAVAESKTELCQVTQSIRTSSAHAGSSSLSDDQNPKPIGDNKRLLKRHPRSERVDSGVQRTNSRVATSQKPHAKVVPLDADLSKAVAINCSNKAMETAEDGRLGWSADLMLFASLVFDGLTSGQQERLKTEYGTGGYTMMFFMDSLISLYLLVPLALTNEFGEFLSFCEKHAAVVYQVGLMVALNVFGQNFVYVVIEVYGTLPCALITTARKFLTVLFSIIFFAHAVSWRQYAGVSLLFGALIFEELSNHLDLVGVFFRKYLKCSV